MSGWQPIETAPKDGRDVLLYSPDAREPYVFIGAWVEFEDAVGRTVGAEWTDTWAENVIDAEPTYWLPLPSLPKQPNG